MEKLKLQSLKIYVYIIDKFTRLNNKEKIRIREFNSQSDPLYPEMKWCNMYILIQLCMYTEKKSIVIKTLTRTEYISHWTKFYPDSIRHITWYTYGNFVYIYICVQRPAKSNYSTPPVKWIYIHASIYENKSSRILKTWQLSDITLNFESCSRL